MLGVAGATRTIPHQSLLPVKPPLGRQVGGDVFVAS